MLAPLRHLGLMLLAVPALYGCAPSPDARGPVVLAAASLQEVIDEAADAWEAQGHARPVLSIAGTPALARQVEAGAPADIFISADDEWMDWLDERGLIDSASRRDLASNSLAWVWTDLHLELPTAGVAEAPFTARSFAIADPQAVPAGRYAKAALVDAGVWKQLEPVMVPTENVRAALALVERGEADLGVVYASDAHAASSLLSRPLPLPEGVAIAYPAALLSASRHEAAEGFLAFLSGEDAAAIFCAHGFSPPDGGEPC